MPIARLEMHDAHEQHVAIVAGNEYQRRQDDIDQVEQRKQIVTNDRLIAFGGPFQLYRYIRPPAGVAPLPADTGRASNPYIASDLVSSCCTCLIMTIIAYSPFFDTFHLRNVFDPENKNDGQAVCFAVRMIRYS